MWHAEKPPCTSSPYQNGGGATTNLSSLPGELHTSFLLYCISHMMALMVLRQASVPYRRTDNSVTWQKNLKIEIQNVKVASFNQSYDDGGENRVFIKSFVAALRRFKLLFMSCWSCLELDRQVDQSNKGLKLPLSQDSISTNKLVECRSVVKGKEHAVQLSSTVLIPKAARRHSGLSENIRHTQELS